MGESVGVTTDDTRADETKVEGELCLLPRVRWLRNGLFLSCVLDQANALLDSGKTVADPDVPVFKVIIHLLEFRLQAVRTVRHSFESFLNLV